MVGVGTKKTKRKPRERVFKDGKWYSKRGVELTRCSNTMTEAEFFSFILSHCRRLTMKWRPARDKLDEAKRAYTGVGRRIKWEYQCEICLGWFRKASRTSEGIEIDHITPCGGISSFDAIEGWFRRAFCEIDGFRRLCTKCHEIVTKESRQ